MTIELEDLKKVSVNSGDVLVLRTKRVLSSHQTQQLKDKLLSAFPDNKVLVLSDGLELLIVES